MTSVLVLVHWRTFEARHKTRNPNSSNPNPYHMAHQRHNTRVHPATQKAASQIQRMSSRLTLSSDLVTNRMTYDSSENKEQHIIRRRSSWRHEISRYPHRVLNSPALERSTIGLSYCGIEISVPGKDVLVFMLALLPYVVLTLGFVAMTTTANGGFWNIRMWGIEKIMAFITGCQLHFFQYSFRLDRNNEWDNR